MKMRRACTLRAMAGTMPSTRKCGKTLVKKLPGPKTMAHAELLRRLGCHILQGYALARPMPAGDVLAFATARTWLPAGKLTTAKAS